MKKKRGTNRTVHPDNWVICAAPGVDGEPCGARRKKEWLDTQPCAACGTWWRDLVRAEHPKEPDAAARVRALFIAGAQ